MLSVILHVKPISGLLLAAEDDSDSLLKRHTAVKQFLHRHDCTERRTFVIDHASSVHLPVRNRQIIRRIVPVVSRGHNIEVSKDSDELLSLSDFRPAYVILAVFGSKSQALA